MIASDLHGSYSAAKKLFARMEQTGAERLILLGDLLYHGPRNNLPEEYNPKAVADLLNGYRERLLCVRGNCDAAVDQMMLSFPILSDSLVFPVGKRTVYATHGHVYHAENLPPLCRGDVLLYGHTHVPVLQKTNDLVVLNPGSVSIPKGGSKASYFELNGTEVTLCSLEDASVLDQLLL